MAYMGRGGLSSFRLGNSSDISGGDDNSNNQNDLNERRMYYSGFFFRRYYYVPLDNTYVIFQMIVTFIILIVAGITFFATYKPNIIDPIEDIKKIIINTNLIITVVLLAFTILANFLSKDKRVLFRRIFIILSASIITLLVFIGIKINLDSTYNKSEFEKIYNQEYKEQKTKEKSKLSIGITGMKLKDEKEFYIDECINAYNVFSVRFYGTVALNVLLIILLAFQLFKISKIQEKREQLDKDDAILFDEEENIKI